jgi:predicted nucleotidyltransferase component of viral defense system
MNNRGYSLLAKLRNRALKEGVPFQQLLTLFLQEEFIRRLSQSIYRQELILKGGYLLYTISSFTFRPTIDADYLLKNHSNTLDSINLLVQGILTTENVNDFIRIEIRSVEAINEIRKYQGVRVNLIGYIEKTRTPFSLDFGLDDVIVPKEVERTLPILMSGFKHPTILTYSLESIISEKVDAIIRFMEATGRMKDFFDIYTIAKNFDFVGNNIQKSLYETMTHRGTFYTVDTIQVIERLAKNEAILSRWEIFYTKIIKKQLLLNDVIDTIIRFIDPPFQAIINKETYQQNWSHIKCDYE